MLRTLLVLPFLVVLIAFALSNQQPVQLGLWPFDLTLEVQLSIAVLVIGGVFFFLGALIVWVGTLPARARLGRAKKRIAALEAELEERPLPAPAPHNAVAVRA
jgi:uncharacterized membrane protein YciS (DUF1049 family)